MKLFTLLVEEQDIDYTNSYMVGPYTEQEIIDYMDRSHGHDQFTYELNVPQRLQYDDTYFKTFTVVEYN